MRPVVKSLSWADNAWLQVVPEWFQGGALPYASARGYPDEAAAVDHVRKRANWSSYTTTLFKEAIEVADSRGVLELLKILLYLKHLSAEHKAELKKLDRGIVWL